MGEMDALRREINEIDRKMAGLFEERMKISREIAACKKEAGLPIRDAGREAELIERNCRLIGDRDIASYYTRFLRDVIGLSVRYQEKLLSGMRVGFSGEKGAFAHIAARRMFPDAQAVPFPSFTEAYRACETGEVDCVVLPVENSSAGEVVTVMDLIFSGSLFINQVFDLPVTHCLIGRKEATEESVTTVVSHPQALAQCAEYIASRDLKTLEHTNTALAAQYVRDSGRDDLAAIASAETAEILGMKVLARDIQMNPDNTTRFAAFSRVRSAPSSEKSGREKTFILVFTVPNEAGALAQALDVIGAHGYNMRSLRSRPRGELAWRYYFYMEAEGDIDGENGANMLRELAAVCDKLRLVGSCAAPKG